MWPESSSVNAVNLVKKSDTISEISNFSYGITFMVRPVFGIMWQALIVKILFHTLQCHPSVIHIVYILLFILLCLTCLYSDVTRECLYKCDLPRPTLKTS